MLNLLYLNCHYFVVLKICFIFADVKLLVHLNLNYFIMLSSPYVKILVTKFPIHVIVTDKSSNHVVLFKHVLPVGTNCRDLDDFVCCLSRIYPNAFVNAFPVTPF